MSSDDVLPPEVKTITLYINDRRYCTMSRELYDRLEFDATIARSYLRAKMLEVSHE